MPGARCEAPAANSKMTMLRLVVIGRTPAVSGPGNDCELHFEVLDPTDGQLEGRLEATGNGGFSDALSYATMAGAATS
jgi:hypothetical protein